MNALPITSIARYSSKHMTLMWDCYIAQICTCANIFNTRAIMLTYLIRVQSCSHISYMSNHAYILNTRNVERKYFMHVMLSATLSLPGSIVASVEYMRRYAWEVLRLSGVLIINEYIKYSLLQERVACFILRCIYFFSFRLIFINSKCASNDSR